MCFFYQLAPPLLQYLGQMIIFISVLEEIKMRQNSDKCVSLKRNRVAHSLLFGQLLKHDSTLSVACALMDRIPEKSFFFFFQYLFNLLNWAISPK